MKTIVIDKKQLFFVFVTDDRKKAEQLSEKYNYYIADNISNSYYYFKAKELWGLLINTVGDVPVEYKSYLYVTDVLVELANNLDNNIMLPTIDNDHVIDILWRKTGPCKYPTKTKSKLTASAWMRVVPKCGQIDPKKYPRNGTVAKAIWVMADTLTSEYSMLPTVKDVVLRCRRKKYSRRTIEMEMHRWRRAHPGHINRRLKTQ